LAATCLAERRAAEDARPAQQNQALSAMIANANNRGQATGPLDLGMPVNQIVR